MSRPTTQRPGAPPRRSARGPRAGLYLLVAFARPADDLAAQPLLIFVQGADAKAALARALSELDARGWREIEVASAKALPDDPAEETDAFAREAMIRARETGFDMIRYGV